MATKSVTLHNNLGDDLYPVSSAGVIITSSGNTVQSELNQLQEAKKYLGYYATPEALSTAHPTGENGQYANIGTTDSIWIWDSDTNTWKDSGNIASDVLSVNGLTGNVVLTGSNINATATNGSTTITKSIDSQLTDLYTNDASILSQANNYTDTQISAVRGGSILTMKQLEDNITSKIQTSTTIPSNINVGDYVFLVQEEE